MAPRHLPVGSFVRIDKHDLQSILDSLSQRGYRTIGPRLRDDAMVYDELTRVSDLPIGYIDEQDGGRYRVVSDPQQRWFGYVVGPHSLKNFVFPPHETLLRSHRDADGLWSTQTELPETRPVAVLGVRSCDLRALRVQDRVFLEGPYVDVHYQSRREPLFLVAVNCARAAATCFCHSMKTGPAVRGGHDLALTEFVDHFVIEVGSDTGGEVVTETNWTPCTIEEVQAANDVPQRLSSAMQLRDKTLPASSAGDVEVDHPNGRYLDIRGIRELLLDNLEHARWQAVGKRCLSCANCTMVCPTCFCSSVEEVASLTQDNVERKRSWASCFTAEHSYMNSGTVRKTTASRYRQWLTHKLATWHDQFGQSGCVGCGRCITWCPVGIDITEEARKLRARDGQQ